VPYLGQLGISHLYCSPILQAAPGSGHGYDHTSISADLGGASAFGRLHAAAAVHGMGLLIDIVPNHMAVSGRDNRWWWDVLERGPASDFARCFDIDWSPSVLVPILGDHYGRVLEAGDLHLAHDECGFVVRYHDHELPLAAASVHAAIGPLGHDVGRALALIESDPDRLDALLSQQAYRLASWRTAGDELDYRRFFDVTTLVGLRAEDPLVFEATHRTLLDLVAAGLVDGLRVDHVDGLRDPLGYLRRLRAAAPAAWLVVEKILGPAEPLPPAWPVDGTTGYEQLAAIGDLFVDPDLVPALVTGYELFVGDERPYAEVARGAKQRVMEQELAAETERIIDLLADVCRARRRHRDHTRRELRATVHAVAAAMEVYRTYVVPGAPAGADDRAHIAAAVAGALARSPGLDRELLVLVERILTLDEPGPAEVELALRFQQLTAPVTAKGAEDTAYYRWTALAAANEVGGEPGLMGRGVAPFHGRTAALAKSAPRSLVTLSTHDTKRSLDVRSRLALLSEIPLAWWAAVTGWRAQADRHRDGLVLDGPVESLLYQSLVGAWPIDAERLVPVILKSANEAKLTTSWRDPDAGHLAGIERFTRAVLADGELIASVEQFLADHDLVRLGRLTSLSQVALLHGGPGVVDTYQGDELWDLSLVDPDNRRPVDFARRVALLDQLAAGGPAEALAAVDQGGPKLWLLHRLLQARAADPELFASPAYTALEAHGPRARHLVAFARDRLLVAAPRLLVGLAGDWLGTTLRLPDGGWRDLLTGAEAAGTVAVADLLEAFPVAVLERRR
jgi:(1->4)-alpha-D-glucan 1-alpha-D-glucosylmutase